MGLKGVCFAFCAAATGAALSFRNKTLHDQQVIQPFNFNFFIY